MIERLREEREHAGVSDDVSRHAGALLRAALPHEPCAERKERVRRAVRASAVRARQRGLFGSLFSSSVLPLAAAAAAAAAVAIIWMVTSQGEPPPLPPVAQVPRVS